MFFILIGPVVNLIQYKINARNILLSSDIDDCVAISCLNGGTCIDGVNSFNCQCVKGYTGDRCQNGESKKIS